MARELVIRHARIYTPLTVVRDGYIVVEEDAIAEIGREPYSGTISDQLHAEGLIIAPGFIDTHIHGYGGRDTDEADVEAIYTISKGLVKHGVTSFVPSSVTMPHEALVEIAKSIKEAREQWKPERGARALGLHLEGPYLSVEKAGAQNKEYIRPASIKELKQYIEASGGLIRQITVAPENPGAPDLITYAVSQGITVSIGHTNATYEQTRLAIERGARKSTHTFNGMRGIHHREPGPVIAVLEDNSVYIELITDFIHISPPVVKFVIRYVGPYRMVLVSDSICATGLPDGAYELGGLKVIVKNGVPRLAETGALAGSTLTLDRAVRNVHSLGFDLGETLVMASYTPAASINALYRDKVGLLAPGFKADLVFLDDSLNVVRTIIGGEIVYEKS